MNARGGVISVKASRVAPDKALRRRYAACLSRVLRRFRRAHGVYVMTRQEAEEALKTFSTLCESVRRRREPQPQRQRPREERVLIAVALPNDLLRAVDAYAAELNTSRSEVIRQAIQRLIEMRRVLEELDRARGGSLKMVALRLPRDLLDALNQHAASLKAARSAVVRYAIYTFLQKIKETAAT